MKKLILFTLLLFLNNIQGYSQIIGSNLSKEINGKIVETINAREILNLSCTVNGVNIYTSGTGLIPYNIPTIPGNNNCTIDVSSPNSGAFGTGFLNTGWIRYTFSPPISSVTIGYTSVNSHDSGLISINHLGGLVLSNPCGVTITGTNIITGNYPDPSLHGNVNITVSAATLGATFSQITLTNSTTLGSGIGTANTCSFVIHPTPPPIFTNCPKIYLDTFCYHATQAQTTTSSVFDAQTNTVMGGLCGDMPCLINGIPCSLANVVIETQTPLTNSCTFNPNGTITIPAGTTPFYSDTYYRLRSLVTGHASEYYRVNYGIVRKVITANPIIYLHAGSPPVEFYNNGSVNILNGNVSSQINTSVSGVCGYIPALIGQPNISNTVTVTETTTPQNSFYMIDVTNGAIIFRPPYSTSNPPPSPTTPPLGSDNILTYQMCINNTGAVSFCETGTAKIYYYFGSNRIEEPLTNSKELIVSPNPSTTGIFNLTLTEPVKIATIELYNMIGQKMHIEKTTNFKEHTLFLDKLPKGSYLLRIFDGEDILTKYIIIK